jgi:lipopolysaccharide transport system permease protein
MTGNEKDLITVIRPQRGWKFVNVRELIKYKDLLLFLSLRGIKTRYAQSVLGIGWAIIQPLLTTLVFTIVFGRLAKVSSHGAPYFLFSLVAMVPWTYFSNTLSEASNSLIVNANMISKVYFPRLVLPLSAAISKIMDFFIGFVLMIMFLLFYRFPIGWDIFLLPILMLILLMTSLGLGMILSAMAVQYRDVKHALIFVIQLLLYASPVVYPTSNVPAQYQPFYALNPMVGVIEGFRCIFLHTQPFPLQWVVQGSILAVLLFVFGAFYFRRMERIFADVA